VRPPDAGGTITVAILNDLGTRQLCRHGHAQVASACTPGTSVRFIDGSLAAALESADTAGCRALFDAPWPDLPVVLCRQVSDGRATVELRVPPDLRSLRGHFRSLPIVPGVVHLGWAMHVARTELGLRPALAGMDQVKFRRIVQPGAALVLSVSGDADRSCLAFRLGTASEMYSSGRLFLDGGHA